MKVLSRELTIATNKNEVLLHIETYLLEARPEILANMLYNGTTLLAHGTYMLHAGEVRLIEVDDPESTGPYTREEAVNLSGCLKKNS